MAESFDNMKFQHTRNAAVFRPINSYILHYNGECGLFTMIWKEMVSKIWIWKILSFIHVHCRTTMHNSKLRHIGKHYGCWMTAFW